MAQLAIVADDLTGAADTSACFADAGLSTVIPFGGPPHPPADVIALTTESRDLDAAVAARATAAAIAELGAQPRWIYKKIDSALRGHPRDELLAALETTGERRTIVAPALPAEGRTTTGGRQRVCGLLLEDSTFGGPGVSSDLLAIFANDRELPVRHLDLATIRDNPDGIVRVLASPSAGIVAADAETDDDLQALARAASASDLRVLCGAAGLARQLALVLPLIATIPTPVSARHTDKPILVVAGSKHDATGRQIAALARQGTALVRLDQVHIDDPACAIDVVVAAVAACLAAGQPTVVTTAGLAPSASGERAVAARLAEIASAPEVQTHVGGLVLTGGDVAMAVCQALGATALWLGGEIFAGQPWGILAGGAVPGLPVATKAGSFGGDEAMIACVEYLGKITLST